MTKNDDVFAEENKKGSGSFFKFETIGDKVLGYYISEKKQEGQNGFKPQVVYRLEKEDGEIVNVSVKLYTADKVGTVKPGQLIGFKFEGEFETKFANKGKDIGVYITQKFKETNSEELLGF